MKKREVTYIKNICQDILNVVKFEDLVNLTEEKKIELGGKIKQIKVDTLPTNKEKSNGFLMLLFTIEKSQKELNRYNFIEFIGFIKGIKKTCVFMTFLE